MIKITNGKLTLSVTPGAFKDVYAAQGFKAVSDIVDSQTKIAPKHVVHLPEETNGEELKHSSEAISVQETGYEETEAEKPADRKEELAEIPLNEMTPEQLREYAKLLGVDIRGLKSKTAVKDKIRSVL